MDKKQLLKTLSGDDLKGFEEFIDSRPEETNFNLKGNSGLKKEGSFEHLSFLTNDSNRLLRIKLLLAEKLPASRKYNQGRQLIGMQEEEIELLQKKLSLYFNSEDSTYIKSLKEVFESFFPPASKDNP
jgi:hypothetical protein